MQTPGFCQFLDWDSRFFGRRIGRLTLTRLTADLVPPILDWCRASRLDCLYFLADPTDPETAQLTSELQFTMVDIRVTLEHLQEGRDASADRPARPAPNSEVIIRPFRSADLPALKSMAGRLHQDSRFFFDTHFPQARSQAMFETWIEKSCRDDQSNVFVVEFEAEPAGYIACRRTGPQLGQIDLIGVERPAQGRKAGTGLILSALEWFTAQNVTRVSVVTQGRNVKAQRLYQSCGFLTASVQLWYHRWFDSAPAKGQP